MTGVVLAALITLLIVAAVALLIMWLFGPRRSRAVDVDEPDVDASFAHYRHAPTTQYEYGRRRVGAQDVSGVVVAPVSFDSPLSVGLDVALMATALDSPPAIETPSCDSAPVVDMSPVDSSLSVDSGSSFDSSFDGGASGGGGSSSDF